MGFSLEKAYKISDRYLTAFICLFLFLLLRIPFMKNGPEYFDGAEYLARVSSGTISAIFYGGHFPYKGFFLYVAYLFHALGIASDMALVSAGLFFGALAVLMFLSVVSCFTRDRIAIFLSGLILILSPFNALADLSGYPHTIAVFFLLVTCRLVLLEPENLKGDIAKHISVAVSWFLALEGHVFIIVWGASIFGLMLFRSGMRRSMSRKTVLLILAVVFGTFLHFILSIYLYSLQNPGYSYSEILKQVFFSGHSSPYPLDLKFIIRTFLATGLHLGILPLVIMLAAILLKRETIMILSFVICLAGLPVSAKYYHWGLTSRLSLPAIYFIILFGMLSIRSLKKRTGGLLVAVILAQLIISFVFIMSDRQKRSFPQKDIAAVEKRLSGNEHGFFITSEKRRTFSVFPHSRIFKYDGSGTDKALSEFIDKALKEKGGRIYLDSQAHYFTRNRVDGYFYSYDSTYLGRKPVGGLRSDISWIYGKMSYTISDILPSEQFVMELNASSESGKCRGTGHLVVTGGLDPGSIVEVYSLKRRLSPMRMDRYDIVTRLIAAAGGLWDPVSWNYAGADGKALVPVHEISDMKELIVFVNGKKVKGFRITTCSQYSES